jgi:hypothetical protein
MSLPEEPFAVKQNRLLCVKCGTTSKTIDYIDTLRACAMRWKADAGERLALLEDVVNEVGRTITPELRAAIDAEIAKERDG